jgi:hypothetical protein
MAGTSKIKIAISLVLVSLFAILVFAEAAGVRVHHADSIELVRAFPGDNGEANTNLPESGGACKYDETLIEHVLHDSGSSACSSPLQPALTTLIAVLSYDADVPGVTCSPLYYCSTVPFSPPVRCDHPDRAPPVSAY